MKKRFALIVAVLTIAVSGARESYAQWVWANVPFGGFVSCFAASGGSLFAGTDTGTFRSTDNGTSWKLVDDSASSPFTVNGRHLFSGSFGGGISVSTDDGTNWVPADSGLMVPGQPYLTVIVYCMAGQDSSLVVGTYGDGVFRSTNNGDTWTWLYTVLYSKYGLYCGDIFSIAWSDSNIFAGTGGNGIMRSTDDGATWTDTSSGLYLNVYSLALIGTQLFAGTYDNFSGMCGVFLSTDSGISWTEADEGIPTYMEAGSLAVSGTNLFAGCLCGNGCGDVYLSTDSGKSWTSTDFQNHRIRGLNVLGDQLYAGTDSGAYRRPLSEMIPVSAVVQPQILLHKIQSYPNPFSLSTTISFTSQESGLAEVSVVNILGATIALIFSGKLDSGTHTFTWDASGFPPGVYECIVQMNGNISRTAMAVN